MLTRWAVARPWKVLACGALLAFLFALSTLLIPERSTAGGYISPGTEASRADAMLRERFRAGIPDVVLLVRSDRSVDDAAVSTDARTLVRSIAKQPGVDHVLSYWTEGDERLRSRNGRSALVVITLTGDLDTGVNTAHQLVPDLTGRHGRLDVSATGRSWVSAQASEISKHDLLRAELISVPLTMVVLLWVFGSLAAAVVPAVVGVTAVAGAQCVLRLASTMFPVSVFAQNVAMGLGFGLAVDYALFVVTRYREELARPDAGVVEAVAAAMRTAGRAAVISAGTVVVCLLALLFFPLPFLHSVALAGIAVVVLACLATLTLVPAVLTLMGRRLSRSDVLAHWRCPGIWGSRSVWSRTARAVVHRPLWWGGCASLLMAVLALPFGHVRFGPTDEHVLPASVESHATFTRIRADFDIPFDQVLQVALPRTDAFDEEDALDVYARQVSTVPGVAHVETAAGRYDEGRRRRGQAPQQRCSCSQGPHGFP